MAPERLQKVIAASGVASRRQAEVLIANGRVTVDGKVASIGTQVDGARAIIAVDGRVIGATTQKTYLLLHKPAGVTSTVRDRHAEQTVLDYLPTALVPGGRAALPGRSARPRLRGPAHPDQRRRVVRAGPAPAVRRRARVRDRPARAGSTASRSRRSRPASTVEEGLATLGGLRSMTATEVDEARRAPATRRPTRSPGIGPRSRRAGSASCAGCSGRSGPRSTGWCASGSARSASTACRIGPRPAAEGPRGARPGLRRRIVALAPEAAARMTPASSSSRSMDPGRPARAAWARPRRSPAGIASATPACCIGRSRGWPWPASCRRRTRTRSAVSWTRSTWRRTQHGRLARVVVDGTDHTDDVRGPEVDAAVSVDLGDPGAPPGAARAAARPGGDRAGSSWPDGISGRSSCPMRT